MAKKNIVYTVIILLIVAVAVFYFSRPSQYSPTQTNQDQAPAAQTSVTPPIAAPAAVVPSQTAPETTPAARTYNVSVINFSFGPATLNINKGDTVIWTNQDSVPHQIAGGSFNGPVMSKGQSYTFVFNNAGTFDYHCAIHPSMKGTIVAK